MTLNRLVPVVLGLSALYGATFVVVRWLCEGTPFTFLGWWAFFTGLILFFLSYYSWLFPSGIHGGCGVLRLMARIILRRDRG